MIIRVLAKVRRWGKPGARVGAGAAIVAAGILAGCSSTRAMVDADTPVGQAAVRSPRVVQFPTRDGGVIHADLYGSGPRGIVLAHGGRFNKTSWASQAQALAAAGYHMLAIDFRGYGESKGPGQDDVFAAPLHLDVLAAVDYLRQNGATRVAAIGGSMGGGAAAAAAIAQPGAIDRLVLLGATPDGPAEALAVPKLYIMTRDDTSGDGPRLPGLQEHFAKAPHPKELIILDGSAHAQYMFDTEHAERIMREILRFLA